MLELKLPNIKQASIFQLQPQDNKIQNNLQYVIFQLLLFQFILLFLFSYEWKSQGLWFFEAKK